MAEPKISEDRMKPSLGSILIALVLSHIAAVILVRVVFDEWPPPRLQASPSFVERDLR